MNDPKRFIIETMTGKTVEEWQRNNDILKLINRFGNRKVNAAIEALREGGNEPAYVDILVELEKEES